MPSLTHPCLGSVPGSPCELRVHCLNNLAACHYQWSHPRQVVYCTVLYCTVLYSAVLYCTVLNCTVYPRQVVALSSAVLGLQPDMVKALYRSVAVFSALSDNPPDIIQDYWQLC